LLSRLVSVAYVVYCFFIFIALLFVYADCLRHEHGDVKVTPLSNCNYCVTPTISVQTIVYIFVSWTYSAACGGRILIFRPIATLRRRFLLVYLHKIQTGICHT